MTWIAGLMILLGAAGVAGTCRKSSNTSSIPAGTIGAGDVKSMSMANIDSLLARLKSEEPPERVYGAMCYEMVAAPDVSEYICPACSERTVYDYTWLIEDMSRNRMFADSIEKVVDLHVELDESAFCSNCSPLVNDPVLVLRINGDDGNIIENEVNSFDLVLLVNFLDGKLTYTTDNDGEEPLQPYASRIMELLGIED